MTETATFAAGCFWGVEEAFRAIKGVTTTRVGYAGGKISNPTYEEVCSGSTGHAEAVQVEFDPAVVAYDELLDAFWEMHDPTTPNRQGFDVGTQYRSAIFVHDDEQEAAVLDSKRRLDESGMYPRRAVTTIEPAAAFYEAEEYHQCYFAKQR